jgi:hypothetical protein
MIGSSLLLDAGKIKPSGIVVVFPDNELGLMGNLNIVKPGVLGTLIGDQYLQVTVLLSRIVQFQLLPVLVGIGSDLLNLTFD